MGEYVQFHEVKKVLGDICSEYNKKIKVDKDNDKINISFSLNQSANIYEVLKTITGTLGTFTLKKPEFKPFLNVELNNGNSKIWLGKVISDINVEFEKKGDLTTEELAVISDIYKSDITEDNQNNSEAQATPETKLAKAGAILYKPDKSFKWDYLAGYDKVKQEIKDTLILMLQRPEVFENIAKKTRKQYETNRPKAILFEGPPGTGKTTAARIISSEVGVPLVYVPVENILSMWYGQSEKRLSRIFDAAYNLENAILFIDEIDSLATSRNDNMHEATRRILGVLLRRIDGLKSDDKTILIGATNRKDDLDPALISRFDLSLNFPLPNLEERTAIFSNYAKQLEPKQLEELAKNTNEKSGRDIKDICKRVERDLASKIIREEESEDTPSLEAYLKMIKQNDSS